jgi:hypothetical protein
MFSSPASPASPASLLKLCISSQSSEIDAIESDTPRISTMQLKHIGLTAVVTLLASVSTSTSALATLRYSPEGTPNPYMLELENPGLP